LLVRPASPPVSDAFAAPLLGLAVLQVFSWYWLRYADGGMDAGLPILGVCVLVALVGVGWLKRDQFRSPSFARCASTTLGLAAVAAVFVGEFRVPLRIGHLTSASIWNTDIALYVTTAGSLVSHGFGWAGNIAGINLGGIATDAQGIGPGIYATLSAAAAGTGLGTWQISLPLLLVGVAMGALAVRDAARLLLPNSLVAAPVIALLATTASLFAYVTVNYFLAQILIMPLAIGELLVLHWIAEQSSWRKRVPGLVLLLAIVLTATLGYSPMAFFMQPVILVIVCLGELGSGWLRRSSWIAVSTIGAFLVAFGMAPEPVKRSAEFVRQSLAAPKGWPLGLMTPLEALGLRQPIRIPRPTVATFILEGAIVGGIVLAAVWVLLWSERERAAKLYAAAAFVVLGSYAAVYVDRGYSYEQWKWISFFQPLLIVAVYGLVLAAASAALPRWLPVPQVTARAAAAVMGAILILVSARMLTTDTQTFRAVWVEGDPILAWSIVRPPLSQLAERPKLDRKKAVNLDLVQWDNLWAAYFLEPTTRVYPGYTGYYPISRSPEAWTLKPNPNLVNDPRVRYYLVKP
jgi:hypothetical protein